MDNLFDACVEFLRWLGDIVGLSYKEINIWIFVIIRTYYFCFNVALDLKIEKKTE